MKMIPNIRNVKSKTAAMIAVLIAIAVSLMLLSVAAEPASSLDFTEEVAGVRIEMVFVKGGTFIMGCTPEQGDDCSDDEKPASRVTVGDFYIARYELTMEQWRQVMELDSSEFYSSRHFKGNDLPYFVYKWGSFYLDDLGGSSEVNSFDVFIKRLNGMTGKKYRLPTEAEWEYAARGGRESKGYKYAGSNDPREVAWFYGSSGDKPLNDSNLIIYTDSAQRIGYHNNNRLRPVGTKQPNELGIYDMSGNVWEWVEDVPGNIGGGAMRDPIGGDDGWHGLGTRGGDWKGVAWDCRVSRRWAYWEDDAGANYIGIRLALSAR